MRGGRDATSRDTARDCTDGAGDPPPSVQLLYSLAGISLVLARRTVSMIEQQPLNAPDLRAGWVMDGPGRYSERDEESGLSGPSIQLVGVTPLIIPIVDTVARLPGVRCANLRRMPPTKEPT
jgi:hypothetical protein